MSVLSPRTGSPDEPRRSSQAALREKRNKKEPNPRRSGKGKNPSQPNKRFGSRLFGKEELRKKDQAEGPLLA